MAVVAALAWLACGCRAPGRGEEVRGRDAATDADAWPCAAAEARAKALHDALLEGLAAGRVAGAVALVGRGDEELACAAAGLRAVEPRAEAATRDTTWDLASLTKPIATASCVLALRDEGLLELDAPLARWLPEFGAHGKDAITIEQLLRHSSGLPAANPLSDYAQGPDEAWRRICALAPKHPPGARRVYSDIGYIALGKLVERLDGCSLAASARRRVFDPCGMRDAAFVLDAERRARCAPTEALANAVPRGVVHDPRARALGGVAGHAGLHATLDDVARWCRMVLAGGELDGVRVLSEDACRLLFEPRALGDGSAPRTIALDADPANSARGALFPAGRSVGHTGFTGTSLWLDPAAGGFVVLLSSRLHPAGDGDAKPLRRTVADAAWRMLAAPSSARLVRCSSCPGG
ncbi:MAG: Thiamine biosynthesis lipoprotein ApbE precursor [Planctomycetota bacterium]